MKLVVPYVSELQGEDGRLVRLAEFLGIRCETLRLDRQVQQHAQYIAEAVSDQDSCLVVNPRVMQDWGAGGTLQPDLVSCILSRFPYVLVHGLRPHPFDTNAIGALSHGRLQAVHAIERADQLYEIAADSEDVCGAFSGLSFGPAEPANDRALSVTANDFAVRRLISIGGDPFMVAIKSERNEILFVASEDVADLNAEVGDAPVTQYFSRLVPHAMALRHIFGEECWRPDEQHASVIIDDPLLRRSYGFLNFEFLLGLMKQHNFHTTIAFIPHNYRRNSPRVTRMFRENASRLSICFHGNDHTTAELASTDTTLLNTMLNIGERRMNAHQEITGIHCDKVMVFPQGCFSVAAMKVLKSRNFYAAVNTDPHPAGQQVHLTIGELAQPAVLRYEGFPLFIRKYVKEIENHDIAFNLFFGRPVLIVEHHDIFEHPELLADVVGRINSLAPGIRWANLENAIGNSNLRRRAPNGTLQIRAYSGTVRIANPSGVVERCSVEWSHSGKYPPVEQVLRNGTPFPRVEVDDARIRVLIELPPGTSHTFSVIYRNEDTTLGNLGFRWNTRAFLRRRLSEARDNYLSKNRHALAVAKALRPRL